MIFNVPESLKQYTPVINWLFRVFEDHNEIGTESLLHNKIRYLLKIYDGADNTNKLASDLAQIDFCWQIRTMALTDHEAPEYWNPLTETYRAFYTRAIQNKKNVTTLDRLGSNPPSDMIITHINTILREGHHPFLEIDDESYRHKYAPPTLDLFEDEP